MAEKSAWERTVELTITVGERILAPIARFIGRRSLVGDATFFPLERFPWVEHIENNWQTIREEAERLLEDREDLADETRVVLFVDVLRPLPRSWSQINRAIVKAIGYSPFVLDAKRNQEAWERRYRERKQAQTAAA